MNARLNIEFGTGDTKYYGEFLGLDWPVGQPLPPLVVRLGFEDGDRVVPIGLTVNEEGLAWYRTLRFGEDSEPGRVYRLLDIDVYELVEPEQDASVLDALKAKES